MTQPGIEPQCLEPLANTLPTRVRSISSVDGDISFMSPPKIHSELSSRTHGTMDTGV